MKPHKFISFLAPLAIKDMENTGVKASLTTAQAILESAWGRLIPEESNNIFGIKYTPDWPGGYVEATTHEYVNGKRVTIKAKFRKYVSWNESLSNHSVLLLKPRYRDVLTAKTGEDAAKAVHKSGYATDPKYANKLIRLMKIYNLTQYDIPNWKAVVMHRLVSEGIINSNHDPDSPVTWAELAAVIGKVLDK